MRVLIAEGERILADSVAERLRRAAFAVDLVSDGSAALERIELHAYDVVVLDRDLSGIRGDAVCQAIVASRSTARILMVTAAATVDDRVEGLTLGADDCLPKPFALAELTARVHALARRARPAAPPVLERSGVRLDPARREVFREGSQVRLANKEFAVLTELLLAEGAVVSAEQLLEKAWDENTDPFTNTVRVTVMKLRKKLGEPQVVETISGAGYRVR
ncbi:response regulator transcription factor [Streptomyces sp. T028]|uniref:response regulator transcription factor n=1 Tax=Streptomyces sp. T028 TaxID=3394379 RepID=UPI003A8A59D2